MNIIRKEVTRQMKNDKDILYIVIPAYNEETNIEKCINDWYPIVEKNDGGDCPKTRII